MKKQIKDAIKYIMLGGKQIAVSAELFAMLFGSVACATVPNNYKIEKSFGMHMDASDPEHEEEEEYNNKLIKKSKEKLRKLDREGLDDIYDEAFHDAIIMARYNNDAFRLKRDLVRWYNGEIAINPAEYTYEEYKKLMEFNKKKCGRTDGYTLENNELVCPIYSKER